ncbi:hypothetical protein [Nonomuraea rubra]|uniref:hypothetical protein n=1 Tax=Nonomuraea rubra TaxID=46180 RepID=UPI0033D460E8
MTAFAVLTTTSTVTCPHGGTVAAGSTSRLRVGDQDVLLAEATDKEIKNCPTVDKPDQAIKKCRKVTSVSAGQSSKLTVGHTSVLLAGLAGLTDGTPPPTGAPLLPADAKQNRLRASAAVV